MSQYYLMSQLPSLDGISDASPLPITEQRFNELCVSLLGKKAVGILQELTLVPQLLQSRENSALVQAWNDGERSLRIALASARAAKMGKSFEADASVSYKTMQDVKTACEMSDPMEAELFLNKHRLDFLESLRPADGFCDDAVYYYALKLKLMERIRSFDKAVGEAAYRNIYDSVMNGEKKEAEQ